MTKQTFNRDELKYSVVIVSRSDRDGHYFEVVTDDGSYATANTYEAAVVKAFEAYDELEAEERSHDRHVLFNDNGEFVAVERK